MVIVRWPIDLIGGYAKTQVYGVQHSTYSSDGTETEVHTGRNPGGGGTKLARCMGVDVLEAKQVSPVWGWLTPWNPSLVLCPRA